MSASDRGLVGDPHPAVVDHRNRAVPATVRAPAAGFDRTDDAHLVADRQPHVAVERGQRVARRVQPSTRLGRAGPSCYRPRPTGSPSTHATSASSYSPAMTASATSAHIDA